MQHSQIQYRGVTTDSNILQYLRKEVSLLSFLCFNITCCDCAGIFKRIFKGLYFKSDSLVWMLNDSVTVGATKGNFIKQFDAMLCL